VTATTQTGAEQQTAPVLGIIFDKDGTLFDFHRTWGAWCAGFVRELAQGDNRAAEALAKALHYDLASESFARSSPVIAGTMDVVVRAIATVFPGKRQGDIRRLVIRRTASVAQVEAVPLAPLLDSLRARGLILGVATNDAEVPARAHLATAGILDRFAFVAGYDSGFGAKPGPGMLDAFCLRTALSPENCAMIGDSTHDLASGRAAGMRTVGVLTGPARTEDLSPFAETILPDIGHLPGWLAASRGRRTLTIPR
jgi:phosphoglycolate phosphatase